MSKSYLYVVSAPAFLGKNLVKLGRTINPYGRLSTYLTGSPPNCTPSCELNYYGIWETTATTQKQLDILEDKLFNRFIKFRLRRSDGGSTEWFNFPEGIDPIEEISKFLNSCTWIKRQIPLTEIRPLPNKKRYLQQYYYKNTDFLIEESERIAALNNIQIPVIAKITAFAADPKCQAGYIIAPCGTGKTLMTVRGIKDINKVIICCPSLQIQEQWFKTIRRENLFTEDQIHFIGSAGTTNEEDITTIITNPKFCLITTYMSSHILMNTINSSIQLLILDEAHHMAGIVGEAEGRTRKLFMKAAELSIKRLSLTYTPRFIEGETDDFKVSSMDDEELFGKSIAELKIRNLIKAGILPDYRLWTLRDEKAEGILAKGECILEAWDATEEEKHILHHLIVFTSTIEESKQLEELFKEKLNGTDTVVLRVEGGRSLEEPIAQFNTAKRAILINCLVLNEGVDIPIANAVAITYPKQSRGQITQMILRAGRWYPDKSLFHVLLPILGEEDLSGFEYVLTALASSDEQIRDEIIARAWTTGKEGEGTDDGISIDPSSLTESIMIDEFEADADMIKKCFANIRKKIFTSKDSKRTQAFCIEKSLNTSIAYSNYRQNDCPDLPQDPRPKGVSWFDYLNPVNTDRITIQDFVKNVITPNSLLIAEKYEEWLRRHSDTNLPLLEHISDGYFGESYTDYANIVKLFSATTNNRIRR